MVSLRIKPSADPGPKKPRCSSNHGSYMVLNRRELAGVGICWHQHLFTLFVSPKHEESVGMSMADEPSSIDRVDGWKSIADYLDRDVTTVIRWAKLHKLPVNQASMGSPGGPFLLRNPRLTHGLQAVLFRASRIPKMATGQPLSRNRPPRFSAFR